MRRFPTDDTIRNPFKRFGLRLRRAEAVSALYGFFLQSGQQKVRGGTRAAQDVLMIPISQAARDFRVHATLLDSFLRTYELYVGLLTWEEKDRYCVEASGIEPLLRIPEGYLPRSLGEVQEYMDETLASGEITVTETARSLAPCGPASRWCGLCSSQR